MKKIIYLLLILFMGICTQVGYASDTSIPVRVGISNTNFNTYLFSEIEFNDVQNLIVMDSATGYTVPEKENISTYKITSENNLFRIYQDGELVARNLTGPILIRSASEDKLISVNGLKRKGKQALYRGYIELTRSKKDISKFAIVNVLSLKNYLRGVVPNEMPVKFGLEALKAQTVAARNYAVTPRVKAYEEFDLCDSVACQVYFGANTEEPLSDKAIVETNGIIATDKDDKPILALYSSTAGGYTESYEYAFSDPSTKQFPSFDIPYLTAVPDDKKFHPLDDEKSAEEFYMSNPEAFDDMSPYYRWSKEWTKDELQGVLAKTLIAQSKTGFITPALTKAEDFGELQSIKVLQRGKSGKIVKLEIVTDKNTFLVQKELVIRRCFQKNAISLPSANFIITYIDSETPVYKFNGGGFGHGVGLSQWGAGKMASLGYSYDEILQHYYKGIKLSTIPVKVTQYKPYKDVFYTVKKSDADLVIKNPDNIKSFKITVNDRVIDTKRLFGDEKKYNLSRYLVNGLNKIKVEITDDTLTSDVQAQAYVVVKEADDE